MLGIVSMATGLGTNKVMAVFSIPPPARFTNRSCLPTAKIVPFPYLPQAPSQAHRIRRVYYGSVYTHHQYQKHLTLSHSCLQRGGTAFSLECQASLQSRSLGQIYPHERVRIFISKAVRGFPGLLLHNSGSQVTRERPASPSCSFGSTLWVSIHLFMHKPSIHAVCFQVHHTHTDTNR